MAVLGFALLLWLLFVVIGLVVKGLVWLFIIGVILFAATSVMGWSRRGQLTRR